VAAIPFYLVTGYLGSGKTTLLKRFLERHADRRRIAVVQNEFASAGIDGNDLRQTGKPFELLEVDRGSVFCVCLMADFVSSLEALLDQAQPDAVVLEASGLADPIAIAQLLTDPRLASRLYLAHSWCVVDASTFPKLEPVMARVAHQVRVADTVVLNKTDLATTEALDQTRSRCPQLNPLAQMAETSYCSLDLDEAFGPLAHPPVALQRADEHRKAESIFKTYLKKHAKKRGHVREANLHLGLSLLAQKRTTKARAYFDRCGKFSTKRPPKGSELAAAAQCRFQLGELIFDKYEKIKLLPPMKRLVGLLKKKAFLSNE